MFEISMSISLQFKLQSSNTYKENRVDVFFFYLIFDIFKFLYENLLGTLY